MTLTPSSLASPPNIAQIRLYQDWLARERGLRFETYDGLWQWSVTELDAFWQSIWDYFEIQSPTPHTAAMADDRMPSGFQARSSTTRRRCCGMPRLRTPRA